MKNLLFQQADYMRSTLALESAKNILKAKLRNQYFLVQKYARRLEKNGDNRGQIVFELSRKIEMESARLMGSPTAP